MSDAAASRRQLHTELARLRTGQGFTQTEVARANEWSPSKVHRIEKGHVSVSRPDLLALLDYYGVTDPVDVERLLDLARTSRNQPQPFARYSDIFTPETRRFLGYEATASRIRQLELLVVPGLLQTAAYTRAWIRDVQGFDDPDKVERVVESRAVRQKALAEAKSREAVFLLDETILTRPIGGRDTMAAQLGRLLDAAADPRIAIRVIPRSHGGQYGLRGPFVHLEFAGKNDPDVVYLENRTGDSMVENDYEITKGYLSLLHDLEGSVAAPTADLETYVERALDVL